MKKMASKPQCRSFVWNYFVKKSSIAATCKECGKELKNCGNTTNLRNHLMKVHMDVIGVEGLMQMGKTSNPDNNKAASAAHLLSKTNNKDLIKKERKIEIIRIPHLKDKKIIPLPGGRSEVWKQKLFGFYSNDGKTIVDKQRAVCTLCFSEIPYSGNTTNLGIHLAKKHPDYYHKMKTELEEPSEGEEQAAALLSFKSPGKQSAVSMMPRGGFRAVNITEAVASFLIRDVHSLSVANDEGFRQLLNVLEPRYEALDTNQLMEVLLKRKAAITEVLRDKLNEVEACSMIADCWVAEDGRNYCTLMARFIDSEWKVQNYVLQTIELGDQNNIWDINKVLWDVNKVLADWSLMPRIISQEQHIGNSEVDACYLTLDGNQVKIVAGVTNENNFVQQAIRSLCSTTCTSNLPCFINVVNQAVNEGMTSVVVSELINKARRVVSHLTQTVKEHLLHEDDLSSEFSAQLNELILDLNGRWTTTAVMLEKLLTFLKTSVDIAVVDPDEEKLKLSPEEKVQLESLQGVLNGFSVAIGVLGSEDAACSMVTPLLHRQKEKQSKINESDDAAVFNLIKTVWETLDPHYADKEVQTFLNLATFLDPRFKELVDLSEEAKTEVHHTIRELIDQEANQNLIITMKVDEGDEDEAEPEGANPTKRARRIQELDLLFGTVEEKDLHSSVVNGNDMDRYLQEKSVYIKQSPLGWWNNNWQRFPVLAKLARRYLCAPATAIPSSCILTPEGSMFHNRRRRLLPDEVDLMIFLNKNLSLIC